MDHERRVVFVCEHGSAKSVVAAAHFNRLARERHVEIQAVSRGTSPDAEIAPGAARGLESDGLAWVGERPTLLTHDDVGAAARVVTFCPLPDWFDGSAPVETWEGIPAVSEDYGTARDAILGQLEHLVDDLGPTAREAAKGLRSDSKRSVP